MKRVWLLLPALLCLIQSASRPQSIAFPGPGIGPYGVVCPCNGFGHNRQITINPASTLVPSTQTNFPVLITGTLAYLAVVGSSGQIINTTTLNGYTVPADLSFTSDSGCNTALNWEVLPGYVTTTGAIQVFVNIPSLGTGVTNIWMCYGKAANTTYQGSATSTWDTSYKAVWHMQDNAASTTIVESTAAALPATNIANTSTKTTAAQFGTGLAYNGTNDASSRAINLSAINVVAMSFWLKWTTFGSDDRLTFEFTANGLNQAGGFLLDPNWSATANFDVGMSSAGARWGDTFTRPTAATWHYYTINLDRGTPLNSAFVDGVNKTMTTETHGTITGNFANSTLYFMSRTASTLFGAGSMQEARLSGTARGLNWHITENNNQSNPGAFSTIGAQN